MDFNSDKNNLPQCNETTTTCPFTERDKQDIKKWVSEYDAWKENKGNELKFNNRKDLVNVLSEFLVSLPLLIGFFMMMRRNQKKFSNSSALRPLYYYGLSFLGLIVMAISIFTIMNVGFKTWLLPKDAQIDNYGNFLRPMPLAVEGGRNPETEQVENLSGCQGICDFLKAYEPKIEEWKKDYVEAERKQKSLNQNHDDFATSIPILFFGGLVFAYHFLTIRKESQKEKTP
jgi:hypothetical protein